MPGRWHPGTGRPSSVIRMGWKCRQQPERGQRDLDRFGGACHVSQTCTASIRIAATVTEPRAKFPLIAFGEARADAEDRVPSSGRANQPRNRGWV